MVTLVQGHVKAASREIVRKVKAVTIEQTVASERTEKEHSQKKSERCQGLLLRGQVGLQTGRARLLLFLTDHKQQGATSAHETGRLQDSLEAFVTAERIQADFLSASKNLHQNRFVKSGQGAGPTYRVSFPWG